MALFCVVAVLGTICYVKRSKRDGETASSFVEEGWYESQNHKPVKVYQEFLTPSLKEEKDKKKMESDNSVDIDADDICHKDTSTSGIEALAEPNKESFFSPEHRQIGMFLATDSQVKMGMVSSDPSFKYSHL